MRRRVMMGLGLAVAAGGAIALAAPGDVTRVSLKNDGTESPLGGFRGTTAGNGRYVAFVSSNALTDKAIPAGTVQLYVRDRVANKTILVSADAQGEPANKSTDDGDSNNVAFDITPDGRYVVFGTDATNLVTVSPADPANTRDVFRKDLETGEVILISRNAAGEKANAAVGGDPSISADGTRVVFVTGPATNLFGAPADDKNGNISDVALRDLQAGTTTPVSTNSKGEQANEFTERPGISEDGRVVAFEGGPSTTNLFDVADTNNTNDIAAKNLVTGKTVPASALDGAVTTSTNIKGGNFPQISGDGRYVVFQSNAQLTTLDTNAQTDVYRRDITGDVSVVASARDSGRATNKNESGDGGGSAGHVSADGVRVAFLSSSTDLNGSAGTDANTQTDVYVRTIGVNTTVRASQKADGTEIASGTDNAGISGDGAIVLWAGQGQYLTEAGADDDVFAREFSPTDSTAPTLTTDAATQLGGGKVKVSGKVASDPSGIGKITVGTTVVRPAADGTFSLEFTPGASASVTVSAMDGAGNTASTSVNVAAPVVPTTPGNGGGGGTPTGVLPAPKVLGTGVRLSPTRVVVTVKINAAGKLVGQLQRRVVVKGKARFVRVGRQPVLTLNAAGNGKLFFVRPKPGVYRLLVRVSNTKGTATITKRVVVPKVKGKATS